MQYIDYLGLKTIENVVYIVSTLCEVYTTLHHGPALFLLPRYMLTVVMFCFNECAGKASALPSNQKTGP